MILITHRSGRHVSQLIGTTSKHPGDNLDVSDCRSGPDNVASGCGLKEEVSRDCTEVPATRLL